VPPDAGGDAQAIMETGRESRRPTVTSGLFIAEERARMQV
jgi:hypothetical protein